jgi:hypothetical protein
MPLQDTYKHTIATPKHVHFMLQSLFQQFSVIYPYTTRIICEVLVVAASDTLPFVVGIVTVVALTWCSNDQLRNRFGTTPTTYLTVRHLSQVFAEVETVD